MKVTMIL